MRLDRTARLLAVTMLFASVCVPFSALAEKGTPQAGISVYGREAYFSEQASDYPAKYPANPVELSLQEGNAAGGALRAVPGRKEGAQAILWDGAAGDVTWRVQVPEEGQYVLAAEYRLLGASGNNAVRSLLIDGKVPCYEAEKVIFYRAWEDSGSILINNLGDEVRPGVAEKKGWQDAHIRDSDGFYGEPLVFYLTAGAHEITMRYIAQDMELDRLAFEPYHPLRSYADYSAETGKPDSAGILKIHQAEDCVTAKNDATIRIESSSDPESRPISYGYRVYNTVGGNRWRKGNQSVTFGLDAPSDGYYKIGFRFSQIWNDGIPSYRTVALDGEIPFKELAAYRFEYGSGWQTAVLGGDSPYLFYLTRGPHTLTMTVTMGELTPVIQSLYDDMVLISDMMQDITKLTGATPDPNYDYQFFRYIPTLKGDLEQLAESLREKYELLGNISGKATSMGSNFKSIIRQLESMIRDPFSIARRLNQLMQAQTSLGTWYLGIQSQPLQIDEIALASGDMEIPDRQSNLFQKIRSTFKSFILSFTRDYTSMASTLSEDAEIKETVDVWISRGTEWAEIMKEMADEGFTAKTGILVNLNVVPSTQLNTGSANALLLSITSGTAPDVAMGVTANSPVEFAIRDAVVDLSKFSDFAAVKGNFLPDIFIPFAYRGGIYALPETMNFTTLFYRRDILEKIGVAVPDTRAQLYDEVLPVLYQNGLGYYQSRDFTQFLFQHGGRFYSDDGLKSALDSPQAYRAFLEFTEMFTSYQSPVNANFFNRFRTGEMPMGVGDYSLYLQLSTAAPELVGKWGIAPLPGVVRADGSIDRSSGGLASECSMILKGGGKPEAAWEFIKWWSSMSVQQEYAREIEALIGVESRWNSANLGAFESLEWNEGDLGVFRERFKWATETPVVLGGYFLARHITNAFTSAVISLDKNPRDALEDAVKAINRELRQKQDEYRGTRR